MGRSCGRKELNRRASCLGLPGGGEESGRDEAAEVSRQWTDHGALCRLA